MKRLTILAALLVAMITTPAMAQSEKDKCPTGLSRGFTIGVLQPRFLDVTNVTSNSVTLVTKTTFAADEAWNSALDTGITKARVLMGVVEPGGKYVHYFYVLMGEFDSAKGTSVPQQTQTFLSLKPNTRYQARVFMDRVESTTRTYPMKQHVRLALRCFMTAGS